MKFFIRLLLCYSLIFSQMWTGVSFAQTQTPSSGINPVQSQVVPESQLNRLQLPNGVINEYRLLGFNSYPTLKLKEFKQALRTRPALLQQGFQLSDEQLKGVNNRAEAFRQYRQAFSALTATGATDYDDLKSRSRDVKPDVRRQFQSQTFSSADEKAQRMQLEVNRRVLETFSSEEKLKASERVKTAKTRLNSASKRARFNLRNGLSQSGELPKFRSNFSPRVQWNTNVRGRYTIPVTDSFGKKTTISWEKDPRKLQKIDAAKLSKQFGRGAFETGKLGLMFLAIMYGASLYKMGTQFENNPMAFEETLDQTLSFAMPLSIGSFFVGGAATQAGTGYFNAQRKTLSALYHLNEQGKLGNISKATQHKLTRAYMNSMQPKKFIDRALTYRGLAGGYFISKLVYSAVDKLESCRKITAAENTRFDGLAHYTAFERSKLEQSCNKGWSDVFTEVAKSPKTYMELTALLSTKALITWGLSTAQALKYGIFNKESERQMLKNSKNAKSQTKVFVKARGLIKNPFIRITAGFAAFSIVFHLVLWGIEKAYAHLSLSLPAKRSHIKIQELFSELKSNGWDMESLCRREDFRENSIWRSLSNLWDWNKEENCSVELVDGFIDYHAQQQDEWRNSKFSEIDEITAKWQEYTHKATTMYNATYLLYKDIADQVRIKRSNTSFSPDYSKESYLQYEQYDEPLPLFRSSPYFGWDYKLSEDDELISYPLYDDPNTSWNEMAQNGRAPRLLEQRLNRFKSTVVPAVIERLNDDDKTYAPNGSEALAGEVVRLLETGENRQIFRGLHLIAEQVDQEAKEFGCDSFSKRYQCYFHLIQDEFLETENLWNEDEEGYSFSFYNFAEYGNIKKTFSGYDYEPHFGVKPLSMGQRFFITYDQKLERNQLDTLYFPEGYLGLSDYLAHQMVFGREAEKTRGVFKKWLMGYEFVPPRAPRSTNTSFGQGSTYILAAPEEGDEWQVKQGIYTDIRNRSGEKIYDGLSEFLYNELSDEFVNNFDTWWKDYVAKEFEEKVLKVFENEYVDKIADVRFDDYLLSEDYPSSCADGFCNEVPEGNLRGMKASVKQEVDTYMKGIYDQMVQTFPLDLKYVDTSSESQARRSLIEDYTNKKSQLYDIINAIDASLEQELVFQNSELKQDYLEIFQEYEAHYQEEDIELPVEYLNLAVLDILLSKKIYEFSVLFKIDDLSFLDSWYFLNEQFIQNDPNLTESEKEEQMEEVLEQYNELKAERDSKLQRDGRVIVDYHDWPEDITSDASPTKYGASFPAVVRIGDIIEKLIDKKQEQLQILDLATSQEL